MESKDMNIPTGATHYDKENNLFFKVSNHNFDGTQFIWVDNEWMTTDWSSVFEDKLQVL